MDTKQYAEERLRYFKVLIGLLLFTAVTFIQPHLFLVEATFATQMAIATVKAWLILMYYMHLKGDKLIGAMTFFSLALITVFFIIVISIDVTNFQFGAESYITAPSHAK